MGDLQKALLQLCQIVTDEINTELNEIAKCYPKARRRKTSLPKPQPNPASMPIRFENPRDHRMALGMSLTDFEQLLRLVAPLIQKQYTNIKAPSPPALMLQVVLDYMTTGRPFPILSECYRVSKAHISLLIPRVCNAIYTCLESFINVPNSHEEWKNIAGGFAKKWQFHFCCGAVGTLHIPVQAPLKERSAYYTYQGKPSLALVVVVDHNNCFTYFEVGQKGENCELGIFKDSALYEKLEDNLLPDGYFFVGSKEFPLKRFLLTPYINEPLQENEEIFNNRLYPALSAAENSLAMLVSRFQVLKEPILVRLSSVASIVSATCVLHNWLRIRSMEDTTDSENSDTTCQSLITSLKLVENQPKAEPSLHAQSVRDYMKDLFVDSNQILGQNKNVS